MGSIRFVSANFLGCLLDPEVSTILMTLQQTRFLQMIEVSLSLVITLSSYPQLARMHVSALERHLQTIHPLASSVGRETFQYQTTNRTKLTWVYQDEAKNLSA